MIEQLLSRERSHNYMCQDFVNEAWKIITGEDLAQRLNDHLNGSGHFEQLSEPISPCIVFFSNKARSANHIGLFYGQKVLHLAQAAQYVPLELIIGFENCEFYR